MPADARIRAHPRGGEFNAFFSTVYVDVYPFVRVQHSDHDATALIALPSVSSDYAGLFGPGEEGVNPILAPTKSTDCKTLIGVLGFTVNSHTLHPKKFLPEPT